MPSPTLVVDLIRHAHSKMNEAMESPGVEPFIGGRQNEIELSNLGNEQAKSLGHYALRHQLVPDRVFYSPAVRAKCTYELSSAAMGLTVEAFEDNNLQELDQGQWTNQPRILYEDPAIRLEMVSKGSDFAPPGGESMKDVADRMEAFFNSLTTTRSAKQYEYIWAYTHGVAIKSWAGRLFEWSHERTYKTPIDNVSLSRFAKIDGIWHPAVINRSTWQASQENHAS